MGRPKKERTVTFKTGGPENPVRQIVERMEAEGVNISEQIKRLLLATYGPCRTTAHQVRYYKYLYDEKRRQIYELGNECTQLADKIDKLGWKLTEDTHELVRKDKEDDDGKI